MKVEEMCDRTAVQQLMHNITQHGYFQWHRGNFATGTLTDVMFAHPQSVQLLRLFPYMLLIDSTYKTNRYNMLVLEIIGVTPIGKHFNVAYAFMSNEEVETYRWTLQNLRTLFVNDVRPNTIVTDRELGLMKALNDIFPESAHLLCLFHINRKVEQKALKVFSMKVMGLKFIHGLWKRLVESRDQAEYEKRWNQLLFAHSKRPELMSYISDTWLVYKEKFVHAWTNNILHFGNRTTNRVESAHLTLKEWLGLSTDGLDIIWTKIHSALKSQFQGLMVEFESSRIRRLRMNAHYCFVILSLKVSHLALEKINDEIVRKDLCGTNFQLCCCYLRKTHGLPCAHEIVMKMEEDEIFHLRDVHPFWRTLSVEQTALIDENNDYEREENEILSAQFKQIWSLPRLGRRAISRSVVYNLNPSQIDLQEPYVKQIKCRSKKLSTRRDPSTWAYAISKYSRPSFDGQSSSGSVGRKSSSSRRSRGSLGRSTGFSIGASRSSTFIPLKYSTGYFPFGMHLPRCIIPFIQSWLNVDADGNCGFRVVADVIYGCQSRWYDVRHDLFRELFENGEQYKDHFGDTRKRVMNSLLGGDSKARHDGKATLDGKAPADEKDKLDCVTPHDTWMTIYDMGFVIATRYNAVVLELSATQNVTYLPLRDNEMLGRIKYFIAFGFLCNEKHYILLNLADSCPLPAIHQSWYNMRQESVLYLEDVLASRLASGVEWYPPQ